MRSLRSSAFSIFITLLVGCRKKKHRCGKERNRRVKSKRAANLTSSFLNALIFGSIVDGMDGWLGALNSSSSSSQQRCAFAIRNTTSQCCTHIREQIEHCAYTYSYVERKRATTTNIQHGHIFCCQFYCRIAQRK